jgi:hypothetical protein
MGWSVASEDTTPPFHFTNMGTTDGYHAGMENRIDERIIWAFMTP